MRELLVLRHAKSDWDAPYLSDFDRPLAKRGRKDCKRMARWMTASDLVPDVVVTSPARRAAATTQRVMKRLAPSSIEIVEDEDLYLADYRTILSVVAPYVGAHSRTLLVGHNPGLDDLVLHLADGPPPRAPSGKLMTTAALAWFRVPDDALALDAGSCELHALIRPRELRDAAR